MYVNFHEYLSAPELMTGQNAVANQDSNVWFSQSICMSIYSHPELMIGQNAAMNLTTHLWVKVSQFP